MGMLDIVVFVGFVAAVMTVGLWKGRAVDEDHDGTVDAQDYFLAGRQLTWWLVGFSLIAANISTEQFVGMSGKAADWLGMAIASYEWLAAVTLVVVAFVFLPRFLKSGIYTIPEFLEHRYYPLARTFMAVATMIILVGVPTASVIYSGAKVITIFFQGSSPFGLDLGSITVGCWIIGSLAAIYVFAGGLKACAWADLIQGAALILGGMIVAWLALAALGRAEPGELIRTARNEQITVEGLRPQGPVARFFALNQGPLPEGKLHMKRGLDDKEIPWSALILGLWIPNFFYWGLNQYITQRTLGARSLAEGQKGIVFAAFLKLLIPFIVVIPGILAFNLFSDDLRGAALVKNAKTIAAYAPELYDQLSDAMKPELNNPLYANDIRSIRRNAEQARRRAGDSPSVFRFTERFSADQAGDARRILEHNASVLGRTMPPGDALFALNEQLLGESLAKVRGVKARELVLRDYDAAFPVLLKNLLPLHTGLRGFVLAAIFGAVVSSLASMLNSASTIASMDIYRQVRRGATQSELVAVGRLCVILFVLIAILIAPGLDNPAFGGIFTFIQEFQGFISPGILAVFIFGLLVHRAPRACGTVGLALSPLLYGLFKFGHRLPLVGEMSMLQRVTTWSFLDRMSLTFLLVMAALVAMRWIAPLERPIDLPVNERMNLDSSRTAQLFGVLVIGLTVALYVIFW